jgi:hypothetical protein
MKFHLSLALLLMFMSGCTSVPDRIVTVTKNESGERIRTTIEDSWTANSEAVVETNHTGAWDYRELKAGHSTTVRLYHHYFMMETFDGAAAYEIVFQLPAEVAAGQQFVLKTKPAVRPASGDNFVTRTASLKDGEITASRFGNPLMGWMKEAKTANVRIVSLTKSEAVIRLRLKADLEEGFDFDKDEEFRLKVRSYVPAHGKR